VTGRAEYRDGARENRYGVTAAALKQIGEGSALGARSNGSPPRRRAERRRAPQGSS
jgi:hypothetical protein